MSQIYTDCRNLFNFLVEIDAMTTITIHILDTLDTIKQTCSQDKCEVYLCLASDTPILSIELIGNPNDSRKRIMCSLVIKLHSRNVKSFNFSNNFIQNISFSYDSDFTNIDVLNISLNPIENINLSKLLNLRELYISGDEFGFSLDLSFNVKLKILDLRKTVLQKIKYPDNCLIETLIIHGVVHMVEQSLPMIQQNSANTRLDRLIDTTLLKKMRFLKKIEIVDVEIPSLILNLNDLPDLRDVQLIRNNMSELVIESNNMCHELTHGLKRLVVNSNRVKSISFDQMTIKNIVELDISDNEISGTYDLSNFSNLQSFSAASQSIDNVILPYVFANKIKGLEKINLANNKIECVDISKHLAIKQLILKSNLLKNLDISCHDDLEILDVSFNMISNIGEIKISRCCVMLKHIDISKNYMLVEDQIDLRIYDQLSYINISDTMGSNLFQVHVPSKNLKCIVIENSDVLELTFDVNTIHKKVTPNNIMVRNNKKLEKISMKTYTNPIKIDNLDISENPALHVLDIPLHCSVGSLNVAGMNILKITHCDNKLTVPIFPLIKIEKRSVSECTFLVNVSDMYEIDLSCANLRRNSFVMNKIFEIDLTWLNKILNIRTIILKGASVLDITYPGDYSIKNTSYVRSTDYLTQKYHHQIKSDIIIIIDDDCTINTKYSGLPGGGEHEKIQKRYMFPYIFYLIIGMMVLCIITLIIVHMRIKSFTMGL